MPPAALISSMASRAVFQHELPEWLMAPVMSVAMPTLIGAAA